MLIYVAGGILATCTDTYQRGQDAVLHEMFICDRVQASSGVSPAQPLWLETVQVYEMQLLVCQQIHAEQSHEEPHKRVSVPMCGLYICHEILP